MAVGNKLDRINKIFILIMLGTFTVVELLYIPDEYKWAFDGVLSFIAHLFK